MIDVFNGDADGLLARHQFRLSQPVASEKVTLITGVKRDIALLDRLTTRSVVRGDQITVFDVSYDRNALAVETLLDRGAHITYFDHHRASLKRSHAQLAIHIDESPDVCTSLLVDRYFGGAHRLWAIAAAFGDNLGAVGQRLSQEAALSPERTAQLKMLGECLNYNAYGESVEDLHYDPATLAARLGPYADPFKFIENEELLSRLSSGRDSDMAKARTIAASHTSAVSAVFLLPDQAWARRISGMFANHLVHTYPARAHAVLTAHVDGNATVSIRAPANSPRDAMHVASRLGNGGGRAIAAGIESFPVVRLSELIDTLEDTYR